jgi:hypothetical protein
MVGRTKKLCSGRRWGAHIRHTRYNHSHAAVKKGAVRPDPSEAWENRKQSSYEICCTVMDVVGPFPVLISSVICFRMMIKWRAIHLVSDDIRGCHCTFSSTWSWKLFYFANFAVKLSIRRIQPLRREDMDSIYSGSLCFISDIVDIYICAPGRVGVRRSRNVLTAQW